MDPAYWDERFADDAALLAYLKLWRKHGDGEGGEFEDYRVQFIVSRLIEALEDAGRSPGCPPGAASEVGREVCSLVALGVPQKAARAAIAKTRGWSSDAVRAAHKNELKRRKATG